MTTTAATLKGEARKAAAAVDCHAAEAAARAAREEAGNTPERAKAAPLFYQAAALFRRAVASYAGRGPRRAMLDAAAAMEEAGERAAAQAAAQSKEDKAAAQALTTAGRAACRALLPLFPFYTLKAAADFARGLGVTIRREESDGYTTGPRFLEVFPRGQGRRAVMAETPAEAAYLAAVFALDESRNVFAFSGPSLAGRAEVITRAALKAAGIEQAAAVDSVEIAPGPAPVAEVRIRATTAEAAARFAEYARNVPALCHAAQEAAAELAATLEEEGPDGGPDGGPEGPGPVERPGLAAEAAKGAATRYAAAQAATAKGAAKAAAEAARKAAKAAEAGDVDSLIDHAADAARAARFAATAADNAAEAARQAGNATAARYHATAAAFHRQAADAAAEAAEEEAAALDFARACPGPLFFELDAADAPRARFAIAL